VADKRIPVTCEVWEDLSDIKRPVETFANLLAEMIEHEKKRRKTIWAGPQSGRLQSVKK
jgi:predicted CopG family antitoxin